MTPALTLTVVTEDGGASGWKPVVTLVKALCNRLIHGVRWESVEIAPRDLDARRWMAGNAWRSADTRTSLARYIATRLLLPGAPHIVFMHVDADAVWRDRDFSNSDNVRQATGRLRSAVRQLLQGRCASPDDALQRLHYLFPTYSMEAWLYQATDVARRCCDQRGCGKHHALYASWAADRTQLDAIDKIKEADHCLRDEHKEALAEGFPTREVCEAGRSFAVAVEDAAVDGELLHALMATGQVTRD